jgi:hypothetical protein
MRGNSPSPRTSRRAAGGSKSGRPPRVRTCPSPAGPAHRMRDRPGYRSAAVRRRSRQATTRPGGQPCPAKPASCTPASSLPVRRRSGLPLLCTAGVARRDPRAAVGAAVALLPPARNTVTPVFSVHESAPSGRRATCWPVTGYVTNQGHIVHTVLMPSGHIPRRPENIAQVRVCVWRAGSSWEFRLSWCRVTPVTPPHVGTSDA